MNIKANGLRSTVKSTLCCPFCGYELEGSPEIRKALAVCSLCRCHFPIADAIPSSATEQGGVAGLLKQLLTRWSYSFREIPPVQLMQEKIELVDVAFRKEGIHSFADFGGVWNVHGGYTFYVLSKYKISKAYLIDTFYTDTVFRFARKYPQCELIRADIRDSDTIGRIQKIDLGILFDVLLHQINWKEVLAFCARKTDIIAIYQPQYLGEKTTKLLELGMKRYFELVPDIANDRIYKYLFTGKHNEVKDSPAIWQWGITDDDLIKTASNLGYDVIYTSEGSHWINPKFQSKGFLFRKQTSL